MTRNHKDDHLRKEQAMLRTIPVKSHRTKRSAFFVAGVYLVLSLLWILFSDRMLFMMTDDIETLNHISNLKGYGFVVLSALLIWWLVYKALRRMSVLNRELSLALETEQTLGEELLDRNREIEKAHAMLVHKNDTLLQYQENIRAMLYRDDWTGLPNRRALKDFLERHIGHDAVAPLVLMYLDLDNFKLINDVHGHSRGDMYIRAIARMVKDLLGQEWSLFRMGGDEFVCCRPEELSEKELNSIASEVRQVCAQTVAIEGVSVHGSVSVGIARFPEHGTTAEDLLKHADIAMYAAKRAGRNHAALYDIKMAEPVNRRFQLEAALRVALEREEFHLVYQPQISLRDRRILGFEALLRWNSAELGHVSPAVFIPVAEEGHHILPIGAWVMRSACRFLSELRSRGYGDLVMAVNVSMIQLLQDGFADLAMEIAVSEGIPPHCLELEITESILMESRERVLPVLYALRKKGFNISLDDFGQGYSSLNYLMSMPIQVLKIDKRFIDAIGIPGPGETVLGSILALGRRLHLRTVAEGVETDTQRKFLENGQCDSLQGYLFSKPLPAPAALSLLEMWDRSTPETDMLPRK